MLDAEWLRTFVPVGEIREGTQWRPTGACVFVARHDLVWCVTALHVMPKDDINLGVLVHVDGARTLFDLTDLIANDDALDWVSDSEHDLMAVPMPTPPGIGIKAISEKQTFLLEKILPGMSCLTGGCPYGLPGLDPNDTTPLILDGVVSGKDDVADRLFMSTPTFQGNSGGPVFVVRSPFNAAGGASLGRQTVGLAGIVLEVHTIQPTTSGAVPLRLGVGVGVRSVLGLLDGPRAAKIAATIKSRTSNAPS